MTSSAISREFLDGFLRKKLGVEKLRDFQLTHALDICHGRDLFLVVAAGGGKTYVMAASPLVAQHLGQSAIGFIIVPTKILTEQHVCPLAHHVERRIHTCFFPLGGDLR